MALQKARSWTKSNRRSPRSTLLTYDCVSSMRRISCTLGSWF